jgi:hypothetical protein
MASFEPFVDASGSEISRYSVYLLYRWITGTGAPRNSRALHRAVRRLWLENVEVLCLLALLVQKCRY